ncbi:SusD/RagB family nutrient-binding outer membrane lipoprotein [Elizabethkingia miricola]|uniref:SusD/RagB family nutrient-binding outer membrane lipoprotein n=1 Tax=Elizabethkingia miricola TaxID=172045 RepID=UPI00099AF2A1|nr:SusD/RagB family nutrient-binding outer membrane lipoprotein [Elizabethkingia miricola]OPC16404.1 hypothetical protein BAY01_01480 [Elizabethkingia miricola]
MKKYIISVLAVPFLLLSSCESDLTKINENPKDPANVDPSVLLTNVARQSFPVDNSSNSALRMLVNTGEENDYQYLKWNNASFDAYKNILLNDVKMMEEAAKSNNKNYQAIGKFFRALHFYNLSMRVGDIPYSEALKGETDNIRLPKYDKQEEVFAGILAELKEANSLINTNDKIGGDIVYNGNIERWKKLINSFRLKILITLSKKTKAGNIDIKNEFASIVNSERLMESNSDNGQLTFFDLANSRYPTFNSSSYGSSLYMSDTFIQYFKDRKDPRIFTFAEQTTSAKEKNLALTDYNAYQGGNPISPYSDNAKLIDQKIISKVKTRFYLDPVNEPSNILSYSELNFILAEAAVRGWINQSGAKQYYDTAVKASFDFYKANVKDSDKLFAGFDITNYLNSTPVAYNTGESTDKQMEKILTQKYMTMFHQSQWTGYYDALRTGYPKLPIVSGGVFPKRFRYPQDEYNTNSQNLNAAISSQYGGKDDIFQTPWWLQ